MSLPHSGSYNEAGREEEAAGGLRRSSSQRWSPLLAEVPLSSERSSPSHYSPSPTEGGLKPNEETGHGIQDSV